jgi:GTP-binding protein HflX
LTLADTVGFIRHLPHDLVAAFRSTLAEAREADLLLHVVDAADPERELRVTQVQQVLADIGAADLPQLMVFNKIDRLEGFAARIDRDALGQAQQVWLSAQRDQGLDLLRRVLDERFAEQRIHRWVRLPALAGRLRARLFAAGAVRAERADEQGWQLELDLPRRLAEQLCAEGDRQVAGLRTQLFEPGPALVKG